MISLFKDMKLFNVIFALVTGVFVAWLASDFVSAKYNVFLFIFFPVFSVFCLWLAEIVGRKIFIVRQMARFVLVGGFADIIDIKVYLLLFWLIPASLLIKSISFLIAVAIKYFGNKYWVFNNDAGHSIKEMSKFLAVTAIGLIINVASFYFITQIKTGLPMKIWTEISIVIAALVASVWNFLCYKLLVFKK